MRNSISTSATTTTKPTSVSPDSRVDTILTLAGDASIFTLAGDAVLTEAERIEEAQNKEHQRETGSE